MLYLVGLGLSDETDITVKGLEVVKKASRVYLEAYTSILLVDQSVLVRLMFSFTPLCLASLDPGSATLMRSRSLTMAAQSSLRTVKWSSPTATRSFATHKMST